MTPFDSIPAAIIFTNLVRLSCCHSELPLLLLISLDSFRWDYLRMAKERGFETPNINRLIENGVTIGEGGLRNVFITKTLPNHATLVTGLYADNHGVVANTYFDPKFNETFDDGKANSKDRRWWDGKAGGSGRTVEYIWTTNDRHEEQRASGSYMWPGSDVDSRRPFYARAYTKNMDKLDAVDTMVKWFKDDLKPINLGLLYISEIDHAGHWEGAGSMAVMKTIKDIDGVLGHLLESLKSHGLSERMNIILTSDHGMVNITKWIYLDEKVDPNLYVQYGHSPVWNILPHPGNEEIVLTAMRTIQNLYVYRKDEIPESYHYRNSRRIQPIVIEAAEGYGLCSNINSSMCRVKGDHGYNNSLPSMHPIFIAQGPTFKRNYTSAPFNNVDLYPLMCHILRIPPQPNDGSLENIRHILAEGSDNDTKNDKPITTTLLVIGLAALVSAVCCFAAIRSLRISLKKKAPRNYYQLFEKELYSTTQSDSEKTQSLLESEEEDIG